MFAIGVFHTTAQTMNEITITEVMGHQCNLDPAQSAWLKGQVPRKRFRETKWAPQGFAVDLAPTTVHDIDEEGLSFYFWTHWTVEFDTSCYGGCKTSSVSALYCGCRMMLTENSWRITTGTVTISDWLINFSKIWLIWNRMCSTVHFVVPFYHQRSVSHTSLGECNLANVFGFWVLFDNLNKNI